MLRHIPDNESPLLRRSHATGPFPTREERAREELVCEWHGGEDNRANTLAHFHPKAKPIAPLVQEFANRLQSREDRLVAEIQARWPELTGGDAILGRLRPVQLIKDLLVLEAPDAMTLFVARPPKLQEMLLTRLEAEIPGEVRSIRLRQAGRK